jgi:hypothetical protein
MLAKALRWYFLHTRSCERAFEVKKVFMWIGIGVGTLLVIAFVVLSKMAGSPKDAVYMVRYAFPHMHSGNLKPGDGAPRPCPRSGAVFNCFAPHHNGLRGGQACVNVSAPRA